MTKAPENQPEAVPARATRAGEILLRWSWVEPTVWTERMLTALEQGVKGGKWFSLIDKVHPERTLLAAFSRVAANKGAAGVDHVTVTMFGDHLEENLDPQRRSANWPLSAATDPPALHPQTGEQGTAAAGNSDGSRPGGPNGGAEGPGTDLRARLRGAQLRLSPPPGMQRRLAPRGPAAQRQVTRTSWTPI